MSNNIGTLVIAAVRPQSDQDTFPSVYANEARGGHHCVADIAARDAIPPERRLEGMICYTQDTMQTYQLVGGIGNTDWCIFPLFRQDSLTGQINGVQERDYYIDLSASLNYKVLSLAAQITSGALTLSVNTNGSSAGGPTITNTSIATYNYSSTNEVLVGQTLKLTVSNLTGAPDLFFSITILIQNCGLAGNGSGGGGGIEAD